jgi:hypothetical protein
MINAHVSFPDHLSNPLACFFFKGALSANAVLALSTAAQKGNFYHNTGEGIKNTDQ